MTRLRSFLRWLDFDRADLTILVGLALLWAGVWQWSPGWATALVGVVLLLLEWPHDLVAREPVTEPKKPRRAA